MKIILALFVGLILVAVPLFAVKAEEAPVDEAGLDEAGALFAGRCAVCHQLPEPGMLKAKQWELILVTMQQRMQQANIPTLQAQERDMILQYLASRARQ